jgi:hypothetical protein
MTSKLYDRIARPSAAGGLYSGTARNAAAEGTRVIANSMRLSKAKADGLSDALVREITDKLVKLSEPLHLDAHELADMNKIIAAHMIELAQAKQTAEKTAHWADEALADLKTRHVSMTRVRQVIADTNSWLEQKFPQVHQALRNSKGLGNHPQIVRRLTDRFLAHESEQARAQRGSKWLSKARGTQPAAVPAGGLMAGPSGDVSSTALAALDRHALGADSNAAV